MTHPPYSDDLPLPGTIVRTPRGERGLVIPYNAAYLRRKGSDAVFVHIIRPYGEVPVQLHSSATLTREVDE